MRKGTFRVSSSRELCVVGDEDIEDGSLGDEWRDDDPHALGDRVVGKRLTPLRRMMFEGPRDESSKVDWVESPEQDVGGVVAAKDGSACGH